MCSDELRPVNRAGFSLIEVCLVLALLIVIASIVIPIMGGSFERQTLSSGADKLRSGLSRARLSAMQSGQTFVFRLEPKGSHYQIISLDQLTSSGGQDVPQENPGAEYSPYDMLRLAKARLPSGVIFGSVNIGNSNQLTATIGSAGDGPWSLPILFHPDGTTTDASVLLVNEPGQTIRITLRGLTGTSIASEVGREDVQ